MYRLGPNGLTLPQVPSRPYVQWLWQSSKSYCAPILPSIFVNCKPKYDDTWWHSLSTKTHDLCHSIIWCPSISPNMRVIPIHDRGCHNPPYWQPYLSCDRIKNRNERHSRELQELKRVSLILDRANNILKSNWNPAKFPDLIASADPLRVIPAQF